MSVRGAAAARALMARFTDRSDQCASLACVNGVPGECTSSAPAGTAHREGVQVTCDANAEPPPSEPAFLQIEDNTTIGCRLESLAGAGAAGAGLYNLSLAVGGRGFAFSEAARVDAASLHFDVFDVEVLPRVTSVAPQRGSLAGGTDVAISGSGFGTSATGIDVTVGGVACDVTAVTPTQLSCRTRHVAAPEHTHFMPPLVPPPSAPPPFPPAEPSSDGAAGDLAEPRAAYPSERGARMTWAAADGSRHEQLLDSFAVPAGSVGGTNWRYGGTANFCRDELVANRSGYTQEEGHALTQHLNGGGNGGGWTDGCFHGIAGGGATDGWTCHEWAKQGWHWWRNGGTAWTADECIAACEALGDCKMVYLAFTRYRTTTSPSTAGTNSICWPSRHRCATDEARFPYDFTTHYARDEFHTYVLDEGAASDAEVSGWFEAPRTGTYTLSLSKVGSSELWWSGDEAAAESELLASTAHVPGKFEQSRPSLVGRPDWYIDEDAWHPASTRAALEPYLPDTCCQISYQSGVAGTGRIGPLTRAAIEHFYGGGVRHPKAAARYRTPPSLRRWHPTRARLHPAGPCAAWHPARARRTISSLLLWSSEWQRRVLPCDEARRRGVRRAGRRAHRLLLRQGGQPLGQVPHRLLGDQSR